MTPDAVRCNPIDAERSPTRLLARFYRQGQSVGARCSTFLRAQLSNWNKTLNVYFAGRNQRSRAASRWLRAHVEGQPFLHARCGASLIASSWTRLNEEREMENALALIPSAVCLNPALVERLVTMIEGLSLRPPVAFITDVVTGPDIKEQYLTASASYLDS